MPYLDWETDTKRQKVAEIIEEETARHRTRQEKKVEAAKAARIQERSIDGQPLKSAFQINHPVEDSSHSRRVKEAWKNSDVGTYNHKDYATISDLAEGFVPSGLFWPNYDEGGRKIWHAARLDKNRHGRLIARNPLGQFLLDAARLRQAMTMHRDQQLLEKYLHHDPPLHPRRTLDQSYYSDLKPTKSRDREQVVYRGTAIDERNVHRLREKEQETHLGVENSSNKMTTSFRVPLPQSQENVDGCGGRPEPPKSFRWDDHWEGSDADSCAHCRSEIGKVGRLVMVDQLWMWILDQKTIITSFPFGQGIGSFMHKNIRTRITNAQKNQIRSVFDIALIILEECANGLLRPSLDQVGRKNFW